MPVGSERNWMKADRETQMHLVAVVRLLDDALDRLDRIDRGDTDGAAYIERAVQRAKRALRSGILDLTCPPLPAPARLRPARRGGGRPRSTA